MADRSSLDTVQIFLVELGAGDLGAIDRAMAPDIDYVVISAISPATRDALPWVGRYTGREGVKAYMRRLNAAQPNAVTIERWVADGDTVVAFGHVTAHSAGTGREASWELAFRFELGDGLIARYHLSEDSYSAVLLHRAEGEWTLAREGERIDVPAPDQPYARPLQAVTVR